MTTRPLIDRMAEALREARRLMWEFGFPENDLQEIRALLSEYDSQKDNSNG